MKPKSNGNEDATKHVRARGARHTDHRNSRGGHVTETGSFIPWKLLISYGRPGRCTCADPSIRRTSTPLRARRRKHLRRKGPSAKRPSRKVKQHWARSDGEWNRTRDFQEAISQDFFYRRCRTMFTNFMSLGARLYVFIL